MYRLVVEAHGGRCITRCFRETPLSSDVLYHSGALWGQRWQHIEHSSIIDGAPVIYIKDTACTRRSDFTLRLLVSVFNLPKACVGVSNIYCF